MTEHSTPPVRVEERYVLTGGAQFLRVAGHEYVMPHAGDVTRDWLDPLAQMVEDARLRHEIIKLHGELSDDKGTWLTSMIINPDVIAYVEIRLIDVATGDRLVPKPGYREHDDD